MSAVTISFANNHRLVHQNAKTTSSIINRPVVLLTIIVIMTLVATQLLISNYLATKGAKLNQINNEANTINNENVQLKVKIAGLSSLTYIEKQAESQGFKRAVNYFYINQAIPLALK